MFQKVNDPDLLETVIADLIRENCSIDDEGIGYFEAAGITGNDVQLVTNSNTGDILIDVTDMLIDDEPVTLDGLKAVDLEEFSIEVHKSGDGDPDQCAEYGRTRCGDCRACESTDLTFDVKLKEIKKVDEKIIAIYNV